MKAPLKTHKSSEPPAHPQKYAKNSWKPSDVVCEQCGQNTNKWDTEARCWICVDKARVLHSCLRLAYAVQMQKKQQRSGDSVYTSILGRNQAWKLDCWISRYVINDAAQDQKCQMK